LKDGKREVLVEALPRRRGGLFVAVGPSWKRKGYVVRLDHKAEEELVDEMVVWAKDSLDYAHKHDQRKLGCLLEAVVADVKLEQVLLALPLGGHLGYKWGSAHGKAMHKNQLVADMATAALARQARARAKRPREPFEGALKAVLETEAGRQLGELRDGPHHDESAQRWQEDLPQRRAEERRRARREERSRAQQEVRRRGELAAWKAFMQAERRELELRKDGQLARLLGELLTGDVPAMVLRLVSEDRRQAEEGLVALMSNGKVFYKHIEELSEEDMPARVTANRLRTSWLKEWQDGWSGTGYL
jgi:hypothetical protein